MDKKILYPQNTECVLNIENIQLKLLIDKSSELTDGNLMMPVSSNTYANHTTHRHAHIEIFCCPEGSFSINTENSIIHLYTGDIAIIPIGLAHNMLPVLKKECWAAIRFQYTFKKQKNCKDLYAILNSLCSDSIKIFRNTKESADAINRIYKNIPTTQNPYLLTLELFDVLYKLTESDIVQLDKDIIKDISENHDSDMQRNEILDYFINKCYMYKLTPAVLAEELHISERQITRIIQKKYGEPFHKVLLAKRIMVAEQMLIKSDIRIQDIALSVGFHSPDIFYKEFKKKHNMTPGKFRTNYNTMVAEK